MAKARFIGHKAQTAVELAVFGAILIFALGAIVRGGVNRGNQQNAIYRATRMALTMSYQTSASMTIGSRKTASVVVVEDRLSAGSGKYGPIDRSPSFMMGSGSHSANLFMPIDFGDTEDLSVFDVFVNGQHFDLSLSAFKTIEILPNASSTCGNQCASWIWYQSPNMDDINRSTLPPVRSGGASVGGAYVLQCNPCPQLEPNCVGDVTVGPCANYPAMCGSGVCADCSSTSLETYTLYNQFGAQACAKLYAIADNHPVDLNWCDGTSSACPADCATSPGLGCNLSPDERFDLDRNDLDNNGIDSAVPVGERERMSWQWYQVNGYVETDGTPSAGNLSLPPGPVTYNGLIMGEGIILTDEESKNVDVDVDEDLNMEKVMGIYHRNNIIIGFDVRDDQDGDVDFTFSEDRFPPPAIPPGFLQDVNIYTLSRGSGTYLRIEEGKLFSGNQYIRTTSKRDTVDMIERIFKISNDTGRICRGGTPMMASVQACGSCFSGARAGVTCFDPQTLLLFIRSSVSGYQGHKWVTDLSTDPNVDYDSVPLPP